MFSAQNIIYLDFCPNVKVEKFFWPRPVLQLHVRSEKVF